MILFGHPTGNPNSHHAALAHLEAGRLAAFCVPWMPTPAELALLRRLPGLRGLAMRLERRLFEPLLGAPRVEGRTAEWLRIARRLLAGERNSEGLAYEANDWLMKTMQRESARPGVTAVHAFEDCSLLQFEAAARRGQFRIYDLPIGYYPAWEDTQAALSRRYADWLPPAAAAISAFVRPEQKRREMALASVVLVPSQFVARTVQRFVDTPTRLAPYGVDTDFWRLPEQSKPHGPLAFIYAGQCSLRKGTPLLLDAWRAAALPNATLTLVGSWQLAPSRLATLPAGVRFLGAKSRTDLRGAYHAADVFVFPSFFEGFGLVLLEAMACGLPAIATDATAGPEILDESNGRTLPAGNLDALVAALRWFDVHRDSVPAMRRASRAAAETSTWHRYRACVSAAVADYS